MSNLWWLEPGGKAMLDAENAELDRQAEQDMRRQEDYYRTEELLRPYEEQIAALHATVAELKEQLAHALKYSVAPQPLAPAAAKQTNKEV